MSRINFRKLKNERQKAAMHWMAFKFLMSDAQIAEIKQCLDNLNAAINNLASDTLDILRKHNII